MIINFNSLVMRSFVLFNLIILMSIGTCFSQVTGDYRSNAATVDFASITGWQTWNGTMWVNAILAPTAASANNTITIQSAQTANNSVANTIITASLVINGTVNVNSNFTTAAITVNGNAKLNLKNGIRMDVYGDVVINPNGLFDAKFTPGDTTLLIVYGNYSNSGTTDFWKAEVIIVGNLTSPSTSTLQNNGNLIVGGNLIGSFDVFGNGSGQIYNYDPNADVEITNAGGGSIVSSSDLSSESQALQDLVDQIFSACYNTISTTWNGTSWSNGVPSMSKVVYIAGNYSGASISACSITINPGNTLTINANQYLNIRNNITNNGSIVVENNGSIVQMKNPANYFSGNPIVYKRKTTPLKQYDYTYWSAPLANQSLSQVASNSLFYSFSPTINNWVYQPSTTVMAPGVGYISRAPNNLNYSTTQVIETSFVGIPNNGTITTPIVKSVGTVNLIGNPYPSAIDIDLFITDNLNKNVVNGTIYLWTHNTAITNNNYTANDYAKYNITGGVATASAALTGGVIPDGKVAAGQGFFIEANTALANGNYTATFKNSMRIINNNNQFFKSGNVVTNSQTNFQKLEKNRIWLSLSNSQGAYNEVLLGYIQGATNGFDPLFDGKTMPSQNSLAIYTTIGTDNFSIQGRALPFRDTDIIPFGYSTTASGTLAINLENFDGLFNSQKVYLYDVETGIYNDLKSGTYTFYSESGTFNNKFELRFKKSNYTQNGDNDDKMASPDYAVKVATNQHQLMVSSNDTINAIEVFDFSGKLLFSKNQINLNYFEIPLNIPESEFILVKVTSDNNQTQTKKIIFN